MKKSNNKIKPQAEIRQSQLLSTFGPGAMVDLPKYSVVIGGLTYWKGEMQPIREDRLKDKVCEMLQVKNIELFSPPRETSDPNMPLTGVDAFIFPAWFVAQVDQTIRFNGKDYRTRPLANWRTVKEGSKFEGQRVSYVPVRFVQACINGHLSDIDWYAFAHNDFKTTCRGQLWLDEGGSGNDFEEIFVRCDGCKKARRPLSIAKAKNSKVFGQCQGHRPWLGAKAQEPCWVCVPDKSGNIVQTNEPEHNRLLVRSASNAYFAQTLSVISIPDADEQLKKVVDRHYLQDLEYLEDLDEVQKNLKRNPKYADLTKFGAEVVWAEIQRRQSGRSSDSKTIKQVEIEALLSCSAEIGTSNDEFYASKRKLDNFNPALLPFIEQVVLVHRLREVIAQVGFTRFEASIPNIEGEIDDLSINVRRADLDFERQWVPAIENKGEGVFIAFNKQAIKDWQQRKAVKQQGQKLERGFNVWRDRKGIPPEKAIFPGLPYIMLHSLSHLLITAVSLECGYAASSIRERIYASDAGYGILLYTGSPGSEGTLGGLVQVGNQLEEHLNVALELGKLCSNDPVCAQHQPDNVQEERFLHGSACHGCLLIAETSCERRNEFLDRALVVATVEGLGAEFFPDQVLV
ncbi:DrmB family protein [Nostoc sp. CALU 546]|uniref:DrmB family protein n=1 Tax=Nostoc sp. CALU 546 TaxID=1867241 RepID=UPI003B67D2F9